MNNLIIGVDGFARLQEGHEININQIKTKAFKVGTLPTGITGVRGGDLLVYTEATQVYAIPDSAKAAGDYTGKIAGIALATNVKTDVMFPQSKSEVEFAPGEHGACLVTGEVAVPLNGAAPTEGATVYYSAANRAFTTVQSGNIACPNMKFSGITEGTLTVVNVLY